MKLEFANVLAIVSFGAASVFTEAFVRLQPRLVHCSHAWQSQFLFLSKDKSESVSKE